MIAGAEGPGAPDADARAPFQGNGRLGQGGETRPQRHAHVTSGHLGHPVPVGLLVDAHRADTDGRARLRVGEAFRQRVPGGAGPEGQDENGRAVGVHLPAGATVARAVVRVEGQTGHRVLDRVDAVCIADEHQ